MTSKFLVKTNCRCLHLKWVTECMFLLEIIKEVDKILDFPPMPRPPSVVDHIRRKLEKKMKTQLEINKATPFKDKVQCVR